MSENHLYYVEGPLLGDSVNKYQIIDNDRYPEQYGSIILTRTGNTKLANDGQLTAAGDNFTTKVRVGDIFLFQGRIGTIASIANATTL